MSVWTELCVCQCLSSELSRCLSEVSPNVCCQICLQEPLDVFQDQPTIFLQYLSNGLMCSVLAGSQLCLSANVFLMRIQLVSVWTELCVANVFLVSSVGVFR